MKITFIRFWEDDVGGSHVRLRARSDDHRSCDHGVIMMINTKEINGQKDEDNNYGKEDKDAGKKEND